MHTELETKNEENILKTILVGDLLRQDDGEPIYKFLIPSYQRGYRWEEDQVIDLLDDIYEFVTPKTPEDEKYCLQPIVVRELNDGRYEVLDGQQRLTTIFILLSRLREHIRDIELFQLEYETRPNSTEFLKNDLKKGINYTNPDYFYISSAYSVIDKWLVETKNKKVNIATSIFNAIAESIEFIWYEIADNNTDAIDVFTRINIGKIPLTNAELVKAVFLSKNNLSLGVSSEEVKTENFEKILTFKQNSIALQWNEMEKTLQDKKVWGFIYSGNKKYETRVDYLLDLMSKKSETEKNKYYSFKYFYDKVKDARTDNSKSVSFYKNNTSFIEYEWGVLKEMFDILFEWFNDKEYNHLIGFLIHQKVNIIDLIEDFKNNNRDDFKSLLKSKIRLNLELDTTPIENLKYIPSKNNKIINGILLFHNVINNLLAKDSNTSFPFERLKDKLWTLEHIFAQDSEDLKEEDYEEWLNDHLIFLEERKNENQVPEIINNIRNLLSSKKSKIDKEDFQDCFNQVTSYVQNIITVIDQENKNSDSTENSDYDWINEDHSIANLALLDGSINSAIKNSLFDRKRKIILKKDKQGLYIPNETKKVFLKYYTSTPKHLAYWTYADRKAYVKNIETALKYLN